MNSRSDDHSDSAERSPNTYARICLPGVETVFVAGHPVVHRRKLVDAAGVNQQIDALKGLPCKVSKAG